MAWRIGVDHYAHKETSKAAHKVVRKSSPSPLSLLPFEALACMEEPSEMPGLHADGRQRGSADGEPEARPGSYLSITNNQPDEWCALFVFAALGY
jgi:hypothetical protein